MNQFPIPPIRLIQVLLIFLIQLLPINSTSVASSAAATTEPTAEPPPSLWDVVAAPAIITKNPTLSPVLIFEEYHFDLNELVKVKEAVGIDPTPSALAQPHSHGRSLGTDWCGNGKPATGQHTLPRGTTCTLTTYVTIQPKTSLALSTASASGDMAIISGGLTTGIFYVSGGNLNITDLVVEKGSWKNPGGAFIVFGSATADACVHLLRTIVRLCESTKPGGAVFLKGNNGGSAMLLLTNSTLDSNTGTDGGAICAYPGGKVEITEGTTSYLKNNTATFGGGILFNGQSSLKVTGVGTQLVVDGNTAATTGGGILATGAASLLVADGGHLNVFNNKASSFNAGGIYVVTLGTILKITGVGTKMTVTGNVAYNQGGGAMMSTACSVVVSGGAQVIVASNTAQLGGGLLFTSASSLLVADGGHLNVFNNTASSFHAGGIFVATLGTLLEITGIGTKMTVTGNVAQHQGGGVMVSTTGSVVVSDGAQVIVADNTAGVLGGGLCILNAGTQFNVTGAGTHVTVDRNAAQNGGGFYFGASPEMTIASGARLDSVHNEATGAGGGMLTQIGSIVSISGVGTQVRFGDNTAKGNGGGLTQTENSIMQISSGAHVHFFRNNAAKQGGGINMQGTSSLSVTGAGTHVFVDSNNALLDGGGVLLLGASTFAVTSGAHLNVSHNEAKTESGGGILLQDAGTRFDVHGVGTQLSVRKNTANTNGGGIAMRSGAVVRVTSPSLFYGNTAAEGNGGGLAYFDGGGASTCVQVSFYLHVDGDKNVDQNGVVTSDAAAIRAFKVVTTPNSPISSTDERSDMANKTTTWCVPCGKYKISFGTGYVNHFLPGQSYVSLFIPRGHGTDDDLVLFKSILVRTQSKTIITFRLPCAEQGVTLTGAHFEVNEAGLDGGALSTPDNYQNAFFDLNNIKFIQNVAGGKGGAIRASGIRTAVQVNNSEFLKNSAGVGGAVSIDSSAGLQMHTTVGLNNIATTGDGGFLFARSTAPILLSSVNIEGSTTSDGGGGGLAVFGSKILVVASVLKNCHAGEGGGGAVLLDEGASATLLDSVLDDNSAMSSGGHIHVGASKLFVAGKSSEITWEITEPTFYDSAVLWYAFTENSMTRGSSSESGGAVSCIASLLGGKGVHLGKGTRLQDSSSVSGGGAVSATLCAVDMVGTSIVNSTTQTGDGGAILLSLDSTLRLDATTAFKGNAAAVGSGGAISCQKCRSMEFKSGTEFQSNMAGSSGGAIHLKSPKSPVVSSGTRFLANVAAEDGGAIDSHDANWTSLGDRFEFNVAEAGSGGAFASFVTTVHLDATTSCSKNTALKGGGGCILWEPYANNMQDERWQQFEPTIKNMQLLSNNNALYGANLATPAASLRIDTDSKKMVTNEINILNPNYPKVDVLDWYNIIVRGKFAKNIGVTAKLYNSDAKLFGATIANIEETNGKASFTELGLQGIPSSGPHQLYFEAELDIGSTTRHLNNTKFLPSWIKECGDNLFLEDDQCESCPVNSLEDGTKIGKMIDICSCNENYYREINNGTSDKMSCTKCPAESTSPKSSVAPTDCKCNEGFYPTDENHAACSRPDWMTADKCDDSQFLNNTSLEKFDWKCESCPDGGSCRGETTLKNIQALYGWSRCPALDTDGKPLFEECVYSPSCLGAKNLLLKGKFLDQNKTDPATMNHNESCNRALAHSNETTRCSTCKPGYAPGTQGRCVRCDDSGGSAALTILFFFTISFIFFLMIALKMRSSGRKKAAHSTIKRTFITHLQMISIVMSLNVPWPSFVRDLLVGVSSVMSVSSQSSTFQCINGYSVAEIYYGTLVLAVAAPVIVAIISWTYWFVCVPQCPVLGCTKNIRLSDKCIKKNPFVSTVSTAPTAPTSDNADHSERSSQASFVSKGGVLNWKSTRDGFLFTNVYFLYLISPSIIRMNFEIFQCETLCAESLYVLAIDESEQCYSFRHQAFLFVVAVPTLILIPVSTVLALLYLRVHRHELKTNRKLILRFGLIFSGYASHRWYWEIFVILRKVVLIVIVTFGRSNQSQLHFSLGGLVVMLYLQERGKPFEDERTGSSHTFCCCSSSDRSTQTALVLQPSLMQQQIFNKEQAQNHQLHLVEIGSLVVLCTMSWVAVFFTLEGSETIDNPNAFAPTIAFVLGFLVIMSNVVFVLICGYLVCRKFDEKNHLTKALGDVFKKGVNNVIAANRFISSPTISSPTVSNREGEEKSNDVSPQTNMMSGIELVAAKRFGPSLTKEKSNDVSPQTTIRMDKQRSEESVVHISDDSLVSETEPGEDFLETKETDEHGKMHWIQHEDDTGTPYYENKETRRTTWTQRDSSGQIMQELCK